jgi:hypothetical protein
MSSVTSEFAQVARRVGYFICTGDVSGYTVTQNATTNSWSAAAVTGTLYSQNTILEDMGEIAKVNGQILRKVREVVQTYAGGAAPTYFIVTPGGEYPVQGFPVAGGTPSATALATSLPVARVARLG